MVKSVGLLIRDLMGVPGYADKAREINKSMGWTIHVMDPYDGRIVKYDHIILTADGLAQAIRYAESLSEPMG